MHRLSAVSSRLRSCIRVGNHVAGRRALSGQQFADRSLLRRPLHPPPL